LNSTLKSLLFWMVLVVVGVLIWNFSQTFRQPPTEIPFSTFLDRVDEGKVVTVEITGNRIKGTTTGTTGNGN
jgi:cell division protease FtsH